MWRAIIARPSARLFRAKYLEYLAKFMVRLPRVWILLKEILGGKPESDVRFFYRKSM